MHPTWLRASSVKKMLLQATASAWYSLLTASICVIIWSVSLTLSLTSAASRFSFSSVDSTLSSSKIFPLASFKACRRDCSKRRKRSLYSPWTFSKSVRFWSISGRSERNTWCWHWACKLLRVTVKFTKVTREQTSGGKSTWNTWSCNQTQRHWNESYFPKQLNSSENPSIHKQSNNGICGPHLASLHRKIVCSAALTLYMEDEAYFDFQQSKTHGIASKNITPNTPHTHSHS